MSNDIKLKLTEELHKPAFQHFKRRKVTVYGINDLWCSDLISLTTYKTINSYYSYILIVIDAFSKKAWAKPLKSKSGSEVAKAVEEIIQENNNVTPKNLQTDNGKEYYNKWCQKLFKNHKINHYSTYTSIKAAIAERFIRTIKEKLWKHFSYIGSHRWLKILPTLINEYNHTVHRTIGCRPVDVNKKNEEEILNRIINGKPTDNIRRHYQNVYKVGEKVRISKYKHIFTKGYTPNYTTEVFTISKVQNTLPKTYILEDETGKKIKGAFYSEELIPTNYPDIYLVEKVLRRKGNKALVKFLGFDSSKNLWINNKDIFSAKQIKRKKKKNAY